SSCSFQRSFRLGSCPLTRQAWSPGPGPTSSDRLSAANPLRSGRGSSRVWRPPRAVRDKKSACRAGTSYRGRDSGPVGLEQAEPDLADGGEARDSVPEPADRDLVGRDHVVIFDFPTRKFLWAIAELRKLNGQALLLLP